MLALVFALSSGIIGGLLVAALPAARTRLRNMVVLFFTGSGMICSWLVARQVWAGERLRFAGQLGGLTFCLDPDPLGIVFGLIAATLWFFTVVYSLGYMAGKAHQRTYYAFLLVAFSATLGVAFSGNLVALYLFYELLTLTTYPLVIQERSPEAMQAGTKYLLYNLAGAAVLLLAIVLTAAWGGRLDFVGGPILAGGLKTGLNWLLFLFTVGFGVKAALMPLHRWLPAAMVAPTPVSALLHAVAVVYAGVYGLLRVVYSVFGTTLLGELGFAALIPWVAAGTVLVGIIVATQQDILKRRLAYQTISHLSYILLGAFTLHPWGLAGAVLQMIGYAVLKTAFFFCAGIIAEQTGVTRVSQMGGVGRSLPKTMVAFAVVTLGMIGMLPLGTFWGKFYLMKGSVAGGKWPLALVLIGSGIINAVCFIPVVVRAFRDENKRLSITERGVRVTLMLVPTMLLVVVGLGMGLFPGMVWPAVQAVVDWFF